MKYLLTFAFLLLTSVANAVVTVETQNSGASSGVSTITLPLTISTAKFLIVGCTLKTGGGSNISGITWNTSENFAGIDDIHDSANIRTVLWGLGTPTAGAFNVVITQDNTVDMACGVIALSATLVSPLDTPNNAFNSTSGAASVTVTSAGDQLVVDAIGWGGNNAGTQDASQSLIIDQSCPGGSPSCWLRMSTKTGTPVTTTMIWSDGFLEWAQSAVAIKPSIAAAVVTHRPILFQ